jgi:hypothetical protein
VTHLHHQVRPNADDVAIEGGMVEFAQCKTVGYQGLAARMGVGKDVGGVQQLDVVEPAHGARLPVGLQHPLAEGELVKAVARQARHVGPAGIVDDLDAQIRLQHLRIIHRHGEGQASGVIVNDEHWPLAPIPTGSRAVQVHQR